MTELNPRDPLRNVPDAQRELFKLMAQVCNGFSADDVAGAAANLLVNAIRQVQPTRQKAEVRFDALFGQIKAMLMSHYDSTGRRKGVFPYDQHVIVPHMDLRTKN